MNTKSVTSVFIIVLLKMIGVIFHSMKINEHELAGISSLQCRIAIDKRAYPHNIFLTSP